MEKDPVFNGSQAGTVFRGELPSNNLPQPFPAITAPCTAWGVAHGDSTRDRSQSSRIAAPRPGSKALAPPLPSPAPAAAPSAAASASSSAAARRGRAPGGMNGKLDQLSSRLDQLRARVVRLSEQLATETATTRLSRWASRHPPRSDFVRQLAEGATGSVHEVNKLNMPGTRVAVKRVDWSSHEQRQSVAKRVATEISVLQMLKHPLLPELHHVYTTGNEICYEMTLCSRGTLWHERQELGGKLPLELVRRYAAELVCVLSHLHDSGVIYVDLKPENVLVQDCGHIMLCDMDLVHTLDEIELLRQIDAAGGGDGGFWGTLVYVAPEVALQGAVAYSPVSDWWGLGVLLYELLLGLLPWDGADDDAVLQQIKTGDVLWPPAGVLDREAEDLIRGLLTWDPEQRLGSRGVYQITQHPFFASVDWSRLAENVARDQRLEKAAQAAAGDVPGGQT